MDERDCGRLTEGGHWFRFFMPYVFQKLEVEGTRWAYLPLNRNYKPLGYMLRRHVEYESYAAQAIRFSRDPSQIAGVWRQPKDYDGADRLWLYNDSPSSRADYFLRFERLMSRSLPLVGLPKDGRNLYLDETEMVPIIGAIRDGKMVKL